MIMAKSANLTLIPDVNRHYKEQTGPVSSSI